MKKMIKLLGATAILAAIVPLSAFAATTSSTAAPTVAVESKGAPEAADPNEQANLQLAATLTQQQAIDIALQKVSGTVKSAELEDENGTVVYGVHIVDANGKGSDVKVDAKTGNVLQADSDNNDGGNENN
jgi:uncharacterized membrane protein YkoI